MNQSFENQIYIQLIQLIKIIYIIQCHFIFDAIFKEMLTFPFNELNLISFYSSIINFKTTLIASNQLRFIFHF